MKQDRVGWVLLWLSVLGFGSMSVSFLLMPIEGLELLPGILFWGGMLIGLSFQIALEARRRVFFRRYNTKRERMQKPLNGFLSFAANKAALVADCILAVSIVATILAFLLTKGTGYVCYVCIAVMLMSFCMHCVLNGRNYFHLNNQNRVRQVLETRRESNLEKGEGTK